MFPEKEQFGFVENAETEKKSNKMVTKKEETKTILKEVLAEREKAFKERRNQELGKIASFLNACGNNVFVAWLSFGTIISFVFSSVSLMLILIDKGVTNLSMFGLINKVFVFLIALNLMLWLISLGLNFLLKKSEVKKEWESQTL